MLFKEISPYEKIWGGKKNVNYKKAQEEFLRQLLPYKKGAALIREIYSLMDKFTDLYMSAGNKIACRKVCANCCYQLTFATNLEMLAICDFLKSHPRNAPIFKKLNEEHKKFCNFLDGKTLSKNFLEKWLEEKETIAKAFAGSPCPFLGEDLLCMIYQVRPMDCRLLKVEKPCSEHKDGDPEPKIFRLLFEQVASDLILEEEIKSTGCINILPVIGWQWK